MPLYYFDLWDGQQIDFDDEGVELRGPEAASEEAVHGSRDMMRHMALKHRSTLGWAYQITDEAGRTLFTVPFCIATVDQHYARASFLMRASTSDSRKGPHALR